jgi:hypothetical protein
MGRVMKLIYGVSCRGLEADNRTLILKRFTELYNMKF